jgi:transposase InsO family protein
MKPLVPKDRAEEVALFRSEVIGALTRRDLARGELATELEALHRKAFRPPGAKVTRRFSVPTLQRWYYAYREGGLAALHPQSRRTGQAHALTPAQRDLILDIRREYPSAAAELILRTLVADGRLPKDAVSAPTLRRLFLSHGLDRVPLRDGGGRKTRLRWQAERPGALWQGDVCHGPALVVAGVKQPLRIHALLDDASRYVVALEAHHTERELDMIGLLVRALRRHGAADALYLDNGSTYRGDILRVACERLGVTLLHPRPGDAEARGKMERWWRTLRQGCLDFLGAVTSLHDVNVRLWAFLDQHYHRAPHGGLFGRTPAEVWAQATSDRQADALTEDMLRRALTVLERRRVRRDNTLSLDGQDWELDQGFLAGRLVVVGRSYLDAGDPPWVEHERKRLPLHLVDPVRNARRHRPPRRDPEPAAAASHVRFDPPGALLERALGRTRCDQEVPS